jgi:hypothetical protein
MVASRDICRTLTLPIADAMAPFPLPQCGRGFAPIPFAPQEGEKAGVRGRLHDAQAIS